MWLTSLISCDQSIKADGRGRRYGRAEGEGLGMDVRGLIELLAGASKRSLSLTLLSQRLNVRGGIGGGRGGGRGRRERGKGVVYAYEAYEAKKTRGKIALSFASPKKENIIILFMM